MEGKCVLIKENEYKKLIDDLKKIKGENYILNCNLKDCNREIDQLKEKLKSAGTETILVKFESFLEIFTRNPNAMCRYSDRTYNSSNFNVQCCIQGDNVVIQGKMRDILHRIKNDVFEKWMNWTKEYIDAKVKEDKDFQETSFKSKYENLLSKVKKHDRKCILDRNRILK